MWIERRGSRRGVCAAVVAALVALPAKAGGQEEPGVAGAGSCAHAHRPVPELDPARARSSLRCLIAAERDARGLPTLRPSTPLRRIALTLARDQVRRGYRGHVSPRDGDLRARAIRHALPARARTRWELGEAIAWGTTPYTTPVALVETLLESPAHRRLLRDRRYRLGDVGLAGTGDEAVAVVELARLR